MTSKISKPSPGKPRSIAERAARGNPKRALKILKRAGVGKKPMKGDELPKR